MDHCLWIIAVKVSKRKKHLAKPKVNLHNISMDFFGSGKGGR